MTPPVQVAVFASGSGTNLQALLDYQTPPELSGVRRTESDPGGTDSGQLERRPPCAYRVAMVVSDRERAGALQRGKTSGCEVLVVSYRGRELEEVGSEMLRALTRAGVQAIFLAGFLRMIPANVIAAFPRRILNIHPALLPAFGGKGMYGKRVHEAVLQAGESLSGPTVHFVDDNYDSGAIIARWPVPVHHTDTSESLAIRVLAAEHRLYPVVADRLAQAVASGTDLPTYSPPANALMEGSWDEDAFADAIRRGFSDD